MTKTNNFAWFSSLAIHGTINCWPWPSIFPITAVALMSTELMLSGTPQEKPRNLSHPCAVVLLALCLQFFESKRESVEFLNVLTSEIRKILKS